MGFPSVAPARRSMACAARGSRDSNRKGAGRAPRSIAARAARRRSPGEARRCASQGGDQPNQAQDQPPGDRQAKNVTCGYGSRVPRPPSCRPCAARCPAPFDPVAAEAVSRFPRPRRELQEKARSTAILESPPDLPFVEVANRNPRQPSHVQRKPGTCAIPPATEHRRYVLIRRPDRVITRVHPHVA